jgi:hypothetical protein
MSEPNDKKSFILEVEYLEEHIVRPMVDALRKEVAPIVETAKKLDGRVTALEKTQKKAMAGWTVLTSGASIILSVIVMQVKAWFTRKAGGV